MPTPLLDPRQPGQVLAEAIGLAKLYLPDWTGVDDPSDPGRRAVDSFVRLMELLIERENRIPAKNFARFLDLVGVEQYPGSPAQVPVTFLPAGNTTEGVPVPRRTRVATTQTQATVAQTFETTRAFMATPARILKGVGLVPAEEGYALLPMGDLPPKPAELKDTTRRMLALAGAPGELQSVPHILYLGSQALFGRKETVDLTLVFTLAGGDASVLSPSYLRWKRFDPQAKAWVALQSGSFARTGTTAQIQLLGVADVGKATVAGHEDFIIAGHLDGPGARGFVWPSVSSVAAIPAAPVQTPAPPEFAFSEAVPLDLSKPVLPFGERPLYGAAFYLGSRTAFSPEVQEVTLRISVKPLTLAGLQTQFAGLPATGDLTITTNLEWQYLARNGQWQSIATCLHTIVGKGAAPPTLLPVHQVVTGATRLTEVNGSGALFGDIATGGAEIELRLVLSPDIGLQTVNGQEAYWIRAILRSEHPYGTDGVIVAGSVSGGPAPVVTPPKFVGPLFVQPVIESLTLTHSHRSVAIPVAAVLAENNFEVLDHTPALGGGSTSFRPFIPASEHVAGGVIDTIAREPAVYLGLDRALDNAFSSLFVHLYEPASQTTSPFESGDPHVTWEYLAEGFVWRPLAIEDGTRDLTTSGSVGFLAPGDATPLRLFGLLPGNPVEPADTAPFWIRFRLASGTYDHPPRIRGIYLNTVMAENRTTYPEDVLIGSGNGKPGQTISVVTSRILEAELWVREPERPNATELEELRGEIEEELRLEDPNARLETSALVDVQRAGEPEESILVRWHRVPNLLASQPRSRHYTLDRVAGTVRFGDGRLGLLSPVGRDNLVLRGLATGGGEEANETAGPLAVQELKTSLPFIDKVFNVVGAAGGASAWSSQETLDFGPQTIKNRGRAITTEDYEWMVRERFGQIAKVRCLPTRAPGAAQSLSFRPGAVTLIVVPKGDEALPQPSTGLLRAIQEFLQSKSLGSIVEEIHVVGPSFRPIPITARIVSAPSGDASLIIRQATTALDDWLHPLTGGDAGNGWEFGRDVYLSEVFSVLSRVPGVDHVEFAQFDSAPGATSIDIPENSLTATATHQITVS